MGFERTALDSTVYDRLHEELNVYEYVGVEREALPRVTAVLAEYLRGERENIDIEENLFGARRQVFNSDEKAHMVDVANLFRLERSVRVGALLSGCVLLGIAALIARGQTLSLSLRALGVCGAALGASAALLCLLFLTSGFDRMFILFHKLLFTNDLWLMDPATDAMIRMFPSEFFQRIALQCGAGALTLGVVFPAAAQFLIAAVAYIHKFYGRKQTS